MFTDDDYKKLKEKYNYLTEIRKQNFLDLKKTELNLAVAGMIQNEEYVGKVFYKDGKYYKVIGCFGCEADELFCLVLDFTQDLYTVYRDIVPDSFCYTYVTIEDYSPIRVEKVDLESLGEEIGDKHCFEEMLSIITNGIYKEATDLHKKTKAMYEKEISGISLRD